MSELYVSPNNLPSSLAATIASLEPSNVVHKRRDPKTYYYNTNFPKPRLMNVSSDHGPNMFGLHKTITTPFKVRIGTSIVCRFHGMVSNGHYTHNISRWGKLLGLN